MSSSEAGQILGVSRQRVHPLAATHPNFPKPLYELAAGKLQAAFRARAHQALERRYTLASEDWSGMALLVGEIRSTFE